MSDDQQHKCEIVIQVRDLVTSKVTQYEIPQVSQIAWDEDHGLEDLDFRSVIVNRMQPPRILVGFRPEIRQGLNYYMVVRELGVRDYSICELP